jgi:hypothetical protein
LGPYSEIVSGKGKSLLKICSSPTIQEFKDDTTVNLIFGTQKKEYLEITGFELIVLIKKIIIIHGSQKTFCQRLAT